MKISIVLILVVFLHSIDSYPTIEHVGFHHNALLYIDGDHSPDKLKYWLTGSYTSLDSHEIIFDTITIIVERTLSNAQTAYSTTKQDWIWLLDMKYTGSNGIFSNLSQALNDLNNPNRKLQIIVMLPYVNPYVFSNVFDRQQTIEWYIETIVNDLKNYPNLHLWGMYLMREDIIDKINEQITMEISDIVHRQQLRLLWIPYSSAINWNSWSKLGIDVAILQPNYAFSTPLTQGTFNAGRLRATAKLAQKYELGVEIEVNQGANSDYDLAILRNYLAQGFIDGYQFAPTAYFLGNYDRIARSKQACDLLRNYTAGRQIQPIFIWNRKWSWTTNTNLQALTDISSDIHPTAVRISWSPINKLWFGRVQLEGFIDFQWRILSTNEIGEQNWRDEDYPSILLAFSLLPSEIIQFLRVTFIGSNFQQPVLIDEDLIIEQIPNGIALQTSTGAPYRILPSMFTPNPQYGDSSSQTLENFDRGLLTDQQWSTNEWQPTMSIGWLENPSTHQYIRIAIDFGSSILIDRISVRLHGGSYSSINWPNSARLLISSECIPFSSFSSLNCSIQSYPSTDHLITGGTETNQGGMLIFSFSTSIRYATLEFQPNAWLMIDEIQAFANNYEISNRINYYLLTPPTTTTPSSTSLAYPDDGTRLTDGVIAGSIGPITGWMKGETHTITIDLLIPRLIRELSIWSLIKPDWAISPPSLVLISTSFDGLTWNSFDQHAQLGERVLDAQRLFIKSNQSNLVRYIKYDFPSDEQFPGWWTMISELTATE